MSKATYISVSLIALILCAWFIPNLMYAADYSKIHSHPRLWRTSTDTWSSLRAKIYGNPTMLSRWGSSAWGSFKASCQKGQWPWGNVESADFFFTFAQILIGKIENDSSWYTTGAIPNNAVPKTILSSYESDAPFHLMAQALAYDWLYNDLTTNQRNIIKTNIETACDTITTGTNTQDDNTKNEDYHNYHTGWISAVVMAGIALYGDSAKASNYLDWGLSRMCGQKNGTDGDGRDKKNTQIYYNFCKSMKATQGYCLFEGPGYFSNAIPKMSWGIEAWDTATDRIYNMWRSSKYFQQMENAGYSIIYMNTPATKRFKEEDATYGVNNYVQSYNMTLLPLLEARFSNGYFKQFIDDKWAGVADWSSWSGGQIGRRAFYFLFFDPSVTPQAVSSLPKDMELGDYVVLKNGWTTNDLYIVFKAGYHWKAHGHADHGNFQFYLGEKLLTGKSGWYDTSWWTTNSHRMAWFQQSISGNCITIFNQNEIEKTGGNELYPNSGGQRLLNFMRNPPFGSRGTLLLGGGAMLAGGGHDIPDTRYGVSNRYEELARYGAILFSELNNGKYAYIKSDITKGYSNAYSGYGDNISAKASRVQRELVYLRPNYVVVHDIINTRDKNYQVSFITHQPYGPKIFDTQWNNSGSGVIDYRSAAKAQWDHETSRVFQKTLLPSSNYKYHVVGGSNYSCYIESTATNYPPDPKYRGGKSETDPVFLPWRIAIQPDTGLTTNYKFLTLFEVTNTNQNDATSANLISGSSFEGVQINDGSEEKVVIFALTSQDLSYTLTNRGKSFHIIFGLRPNTQYTINIQGGGSSEVRSNENGTLLLTNPSAGSYTYVVHIR